MSSDLVGRSLAVLVEHADPIVLATPDGHVLHANPACDNLLPDQPISVGDELLGRAPFDSRAFCTAWQTAVETAVQQHVELALPGGPRRLSARIVPTADGVTVVYFSESTGRDAIEAAALAQRKLDLADLAGMTGTFSLDLESRVVRGSANALRIYGYDPELVSSLPGSATLTAVLPEDRARQRAAQERAIAQPGSPVDVTFRIRRVDDGQIRVIRAVSEALSGDDGKARSLVGTLFDVTERELAVSALRTSEERLRRTLDGVDAIVSYKEDAAAAVVLNSAVQRILGYEPSELAMPGAWDAIIHPDDLPECRSSWASPTGAWSLRYRARRKDGTWIWLGDRGREVRHKDGRGAGLFAVVVDVTDRVEVEAALRESEARYRAIMDSAADAIFTADAGGILVACNPSAERMLGYRSDQILGQPVRLILPYLMRGDFVGLVRRYARPFAGTGGVLAMEGRRADGTHFPAEVSVAVWTHAGESFVTGIVRDVSERRQAEEAIRIADERRRRFFEANIVGTVVAEADGRVLEANGYWLELVRRTRDELEAGGIDWRAMTAPESLERDEVALRQVAERGTSDPYETEYRLADGTRVPVLIVRAAMPGPGSQVASYVLDQRRQREAAAGLARQASAIEQTSESVMITDARARILHVNPAFERVTGYTADEVVGRNPSILGSGRQPPDFYRAMWGTLRSGRTWTGDIVNRRKDGTLFTEVASISPIRDASGDIVSYVAVKRDVTAERALEARLQQSQRLEAIGQLAGGVAHDMNNLLGAVKGYAEFARGALDPASQPARDLDQVLVAADRAATVTRQLLAFGRRATLEQRPVDVTATIGGIVPMLRRLLGAHIDVEVEGDGRQAWILGDQGRLEQVVVNLAVNARDAMPEGGQLLLRIERVAGTADPPSGRSTTVRLTVSDTGSGMDAATQARIFEPFFTTKPVGQGTGLGLATVYGIVSGLGGTIDVHSTPGEGSAFSVDLPAIAGPDAVGAPDGGAAADAAGGGERILVVEDEDALRSIAVRILRRRGFRPVAAASGPEALDHLGREPFDLLLTDLRMPGMHGVELARRARATHPGLPIVVMTGYGVGVEEQVAALGNADVVEKPLTADDLVRAVRRRLAGAEQPQPQ